MNFAKRLLMVAGAGALAGILALAVAPKTAHALVAALVQVSNTPSSAVPVVHAPAASTVYFATCEGVFSGLSQAECSTPPVPAGRSLVIEAASIFSQTSSGADPGLPGSSPRKAGWISRSQCNPKPLSQALITTPVSSRDGSPSQQLAAPR